MADVYVDYERIQGTIDELEYLKKELDVLKNGCNTYILYQENNKWQSIRTIITNLQNKIDGTIETCKTNGQKMKEIADKMVVK